MDAPPTPELSTWRWIKRLAMGFFSCVELPVYTIQLGRQGLVGFLNLPVTNNPI